MAGRENRFSSANREFREGQARRDSPGRVDLLNDEQAAAARQRFSPSGDAPEQESLGAHPEHAEAEAADLENRLAAPSAKEPANGDKGGKSSGPIPNTDLRASEEAGDTFYNPEQGKHRKKKVKGKPGFWTKKKVGATGAGLGLGLGFGLFVLTLIAGPGQFLQLSHELQQAMQRGNSDSASRVDKLFRGARAIKSGDINETRLGVLDKKVFGNAIDKLKTVGVTVEPGRTGQPVRTSFDIDKMKKIYPDLEGMDDAQVKSYLADQLTTRGLTVTADDIGGSGGKFSIIQDKFSISESRWLGKGTLSLLGDGKVTNALQFRAFIKYYNIPSPFHVLKRTVAGAENKYLNGKAPATDEQKQKAEEAGAAEDTTEFDSELQPVEAKADIADADIKAKSSALKAGISGVLLFTGGACAVRAVAGDVVTLNHYAIAVPAAIAALSFISIGEQIQHGGLTTSDITLEQLAVKQMSLYDKSGQSVFASQPLEQLNTGSHYTADADINPDYQQAFSDHTTAGAIRDGASKALGGNFSAGLICSPVGIAVQFIGGIVLSFWTFASEAVSAGALTPLNVALWSLKEGISFATSMVAMHLITQLVLKHAVLHLAKSAFAGPAGGALLGYGAKEAAIIAGTGTGAIGLSSQDTQSFDQQLYKQQRQQFQSESFFARMFSPDDSRTLVGHLADDVSPDYTQNLATISASFLNIGSILSHTLGSLIPKAGAAADTSTSYAWPMQDVGIPDNMLNDPNLQDPVDNGARVARILDATCLDGSGNLNSSCGYAQRINQCFGNTLEYDSTAKQWDVIKTSDVDTHSDSYIAGNCDDYGTPADTASGNDIGIWRRMIMFTFDTHTMKGAACYAGDAQSCADESQSTGGS